MIGFRFDSTTMWRGKKIWTQIKNEEDNLLCCTDFFGGVLRKIHIFFFFFAKKGDRTLSLYTDFSLHSILVHIIDHWICRCFSQLLQGWRVYHCFYMCIALYNMHYVYFIKPSFLVSRRIKKKKILIDFNFHDAHTQ